MKYLPKFFPLASTVILAGLTVSSSAWPKDTVFDISYVDSVVQTAPTASTYAVNQHVIVTLHGDNRVTEARQWNSPNVASHITVEGALGSEAAALKFTVTWKVQSANSLVRYRVFPQHVEVMHISVTGQNCQVAIEHDLKRGFMTYERFGKSWEPYYYSSISSSGFNCQVTQ